MLLTSNTKCHYSIAPPTTPFFSPLPLFSFSSLLSSTLPLPIAFVWVYIYLFDFEGKVKTLTLT